MPDRAARPPRPLIDATRIAPRTRSGHHPVVLQTARGRIACRYYRVPGATRAVVWLGGAKGGWESPALHLYPRLGRDLMEEGIASLWIRFRYPPLLEASVFDVRAGIAHLREDGIEAFGLVGHSFGGAAAIQAAVQTEAAHTIVTLATQSFGAAAAAELGPCCSILLIHGMKDRTLPASSTRYVHQIATPRKELVLYPEGDHMLDAVGEQVRERVAGWLIGELRPTPEPVQPSSAPPAATASVRSEETAHAASGSSISTT